MTLQQWVAVVGGIATGIGVMGTVSASVYNAWPVTWRGLESWAEDRITAPLKLIQLSLLEINILTLENKLVTLNRSAVELELKLRDDPTDVIIRAEVVNTHSEISYVEQDLNDARCNLYRLKKLRCGGE